MKKGLLFLFLPFIVGCSFNPADFQKPSENPGEKTNTDVEPSEEKDPEPSVEPSEEKDPDPIIDPNPVVNPDPEPQPPQYEQWDKKAIEDLIEVLGIHTDYRVPAYDKCISIRYDGDSALTEGYFTIYIQTEFEECEQLYQEILEKEQWILKEKHEDLCIAYSPDYSLEVQYVYEAEYRELVIFVLEGSIVDWPARMVLNAIKNLRPNTMTEIPEFEADFYTVNFYAEYQAVAINGYGTKNSLVTEYKLLLEQEGWSTFEKAEEGTFGAIAPNEDVRIDFYYNEQNLEFNIDVFQYIKPVTNWPEEQINGVLKEMGVTGVVLPYYGECSGFLVDWEWTDPAIFVYVPKAKVYDAAEEYNQSLIDAGYVLCGTIYGDPVYNFPGTTVCYRGAVPQEDCMTIEIFDISNPNITPIVEQ